MEALKAWRDKCDEMGIMVSDDSLYTLLILNDQVIIASVLDDSIYMLHKLKYEYKMSDDYPVEN